MTLSGYEALFFWIFALAAIFAGLLTVMARNAVRATTFFRLPPERVVELGVQVEI